MTENTSRPTSPIIRARVHVYPSVVELDAASGQHLHQANISPETESPKDAGPFTVQPHPATSLARLTDLVEQLLVTVGRLHGLDEAGSGSPGAIAEVVMNRHPLHRYPVEDLRQNLNALPQGVKLGAEREPGDGAAVVAAPHDDRLLGLHPGLYRPENVADFHAGTVPATLATPDPNSDMANRERHERDPWWMRCGWCGQWGDFNPDSTQLHPEHLGEQKTADYGRGPTLITRTILGDVYTRGDQVEIGDRRLTRGQAHQLLTHLHTALGL